MRRQAVARREKERRRPNLRLPRLRQKVLRREWNLPGLVENDDADDRETITLIMLNCSNWVVSWILGID